MRPRLVRHSEAHCMLRLPDCGRLLLSHHVGAWTGVLLVGRGTPVLPLCQAHSRVDGRMLRRKLTEGQGSLAADSAGLVPQDLINTRWAVADLPLSSSSCKQSACSSESRDACVGLSSPPFSHARAAVQVPFHCLAMVSVSSLRAPRAAFSHTAACVRLSLASRRCLR